MSDRDDGLAAAGARLREWRDGEGISQEAAATRIRASQAAWAAWERGEKGPDLHSAFELEKLTDGAVKAEAWAFPRKGSRAAAAADASGTTLDADDTGEHPAVPRTG